MIKGSGVTKRGAVSWEAEYSKDNSTGDKVGACICASA
jgi:hypothetical protein